VQRESARVEEIVVPQGLEAIVAESPAGNLRR
jgi:hypothetical protein